MRTLRCGHCGGATTLTHAGTDILYYRCTTTGCRCGVTLDKEGTVTTTGPCVSLYRDGIEPHSKAPAQQEV